MPSGFDRRLGALHSEMTQILRHAEMVMETEIITVEHRDQVIQAGQLLQAMQKTVIEFFKPIKQRIDQLKQPILEMERTDTETLKTAKERLATAIQEFEKRQAAAEQARLEENRAQAEAAAIDGELPPPVIVPAAVPVKTHGKVERTTWTAEVIDFMKLVRAVAAGQVLITALLPNEKWLNKRADADREAMDIPGVEVRKAEKVHFRT